MPKVPTKLFKLLLLRTNEVIHKWALSVQHKQQMQEELEEIQIGQEYISGGLVIIRFKLDPMPDTWKWRKNGEPLLRESHENTEWKQCYFSPYHHSLICYCSDFHVYFCVAIRKRSFMVRQFAAEVSPNETILLCVSCSINVLNQNVCECSELESEIYTHK